MLDHAYNNQTKLYVQLQPTLETIRLLTQAWQYEPNTSPVKDSELHLTVIHFGRIKRFRESLPAALTIDEEHLLSSLKRLVARWSNNIENIETALKLNTSKISLFGTNGNTLAIEFEPSDATIQLHQQCLYDLEMFLHEIGLPKPIQFIRQDQNLSNSLFFRPHVTICKQFAGEIPTLQQSFTATFRPMKIIYTS